MQYYQFQGMITVSAIDNELQDAVGEHKQDGTNQNVDLELLLPQNPMDNIKHAESCRQKHIYSLWCP